MQVSYSGATLRILQDASHSGATSCLVMHSNSSWGASCWGWGKIIMYDILVTYIVSDVIPNKVLQLY